jgi:hypothetical protein
MMLGERAEPRPEDLKLSLVNVKSEQENLRVLGQIRAIRGDTKNPSAAIEATLEKIDLKLRVLQRFVGKKATFPDGTEVDGPAQERMGRWLRRQLVDADIDYERVPTPQGMAYEISVTCQSIENDSECPVFRPFKHTFGEKALAIGMQAAESHRDRWKWRVLSELDAELGMELAKVGWITDEFGHEDPKARAARERGVDSTRRT